MSKDVLLLPGASRFNRYWASEFAKILNEKFDDVRIVNYEIWNNSEDKDIDVSNEVSRAKEGVEHLSSEYIIVAYSEGIPVALAGIKKGLLKPKSCVFISMPYRWARGEKYNDELSSWLSGYSTKTLYVQAEHDPNCSAEELRSLLRGTKNAAISILYGKSDSNYDNLYHLRLLTEKFAG